LSPILCGPREKSAPHSNTAKQFVGLFHLAPSLFNPSDLYWNVTPGGNRRRYKTLSLSPLGPELLSAASRERRRNARMDSPGTVPVPATRYQRRVDGTAMRYDFPQRHGLQRDRLRRSSSITGHPLRRVPPACGFGNEVLLAKRTRFFLASTGQGGVSTAAADVTTGATQKVVNRAPVARAVLMVRKAVRHVPGS